MLRILLAVCCLLIAAPHAIADKEVKTLVSIEDNMGFVGTAMSFELRSDGSWVLQRRFPPAQRGKQEGKLSEKAMVDLIQDLEKAGAFNPKAKDILEKNPRVADMAYFAVRRAGEGKGTSLTFQREGPTHKAVKALLDKLAPAKAES